jgi:hypothetical protein
VRDQIATLMLGRHERAARMTMMVSQERVRPCFRNRRTLADVLRELRVIRSGERKSVADAMAARRNSERPLGRDMDRIRLEAVDRRGELTTRKQREPDLGVGRTRNGSKVGRRNYRHVVAESLELAARSTQGRDDAVDLRLPCIGDDCEFHKVSS